MPLASNGSRTGHSCIDNAPATRVHHVFLGGANKLYIAERDAGKLAATQARRMAFNDAPNWLPRASAGFPADAGRLATGVWGAKLRLDFLSRSFLQMIGRWPMAGR